jgi:hypothetical protein
MKPTVLVSLVSEQTVPNYLSIKTFTEADYYFFISTQKMEDPVKGNRREWLIRAAGIEQNRTEVILVNPEIKEDLLEKLTSINWTEKFSRIIVNITGGTKMMSLASYEFFRPLTPEIWYIPINSNDYHLVDKSTVKKSVTYRMNVEEYLACCGITRDANQFCEKQPLFDQEIIKTIFFNMIKSQKCKPVTELIRLLFRDHDAPLKKQIERKSGIDLNDKIFLATLHAKLENKRDIIPEWKYIKLSEIKSVDFIFEFFDEIGLPYDTRNHLLNDQVNFITGGWFEEYSYYLLKQICDGSDNHYKLGVVLDSKRDSYFTSNDLDIVLVANNNLYVIECKSGGMEENELFNKTVYLQTSLRKYFGLSVRSVLMTLSVTSDLQKKKADTLGISLIDRNVILDTQSENLIKHILKIKDDS